MLRTYNHTTAQIEEAVRKALVEMYQEDADELAPDPRHYGEFDQALHVAVDAASVLVEKDSASRILLTLVADDDGAISGYEFIFSFATGARLVTAFFDFKDLIPEESGAAGLVELTSTVLAEVNFAIGRMNAAFQAVDTAWFTKE